jgi:hypothetical protein
VLLGSTEKFPCGALEIMQQQPQQQQQKSGWPVGPRKMLSPSDRRMLHDISDNLSHLRRAQSRPSTAVSAATAVTRNGTIVQNGVPSSSLVLKGRTDGPSNASEMESLTTVQNGVGPATVERAPSGSRNDYHRKAMEQIRQSLRDFHVQAQPPAIPPYGGAGLGVARDNPIRQVTIILFVLCQFSFNPVFMCMHAMKDI